MQSEGPTNHDGISSSVDRLVLSGHDSLQSTLRRQVSREGRHLRDHDDHLSRQEAKLAFVCEETKEER